MAKKMLQKIERPMNQEDMRKLEDSYYDIVDKANELDADATGMDELLSDSGVMDAMREAYKLGHERGVKDAAKEAQRSPDRDQMGGLEENSFTISLPCHRESDEELQDFEDWENGF